jgi:hypothetical protein
MLVMLRFSAGSSKKNLKFWDVVYSYLQTYSRTGFVSLVMLTPKMNLRQ